MRVPDIQTDFGGGEVSPEVYGRPDLPVYKRGCSILENAFPMSGGGVMRMPGTTVVKNLGTPDDGPQGVMGLAFGRMANGTDPPSHGLMVLHQADSENTKVHTMDLSDDSWGSTDVYLDYAGTGSTTIPALGNTTSFDWVAGYDDASGDHAVFFVLGGLILKANVAGASCRVETVNDPSKSDWTIDSVSRIGIYQGRLLLASEREMKIAGSASEDFADFDIPGSVDSDAFEFTVKSKVSSGIMWIADQETMLVGCDASEIQIKSSGGGAVTPSSAISREYTRIGSSIAGRGDIIDDKFMFASSGKNEIRAYEYLNDYQAYGSPNLSEFADHITKAGVSRVVIQPLPDGQIVWCVLRDGSLAGMRYNSNQKIGGWFRVPAEVGCVYKDVVYATSPVDRSENNLRKSRLFFLVVRDDETFVEEMLLDVESVDWSYFGSTESRPEDYPYLRHCSPNLFVSITPQLYLPSVGRRKITKMEQYGSFIKMTLDSPMRTSFLKWRIYGNRRYSDFHETNFIMEMTKLDDLNIRTGHAATLTEIDADASMGWIAPVSNFATQSVSNGTDMLSLDMASGSDYYAVADGEIFASGCKLDANGQVVDASTSTTTGLSVYGHNLYIGKYKYNTVVQALPLEPGVGQGSRFNRAVEAQLRFTDTTHAEVGANRNTTFSVDFSDPAAPTGEPPIPRNKRKTVTVPGNPSKDEDQFVCITSEYEGPMKVVGLSAYVDVGGS